MNPKRITSRDNAAFKRIRALAESARERRRLDRALLDGMHLVAAYTARFGVPELLAVSEAGQVQREIADFLAAHPQALALLFSDALFAQLSPVATPTGILAVVPVPHRVADAGQTGGSWVLLDAVQDAGNLGSILRSAAAAGIADAYLGPGCAQAWSPRVLRAAMGAHFSLRIHEGADLAAVMAAHAGATVATTLAGGEPLFALDLRGPVAWVFGNEGAGLAPDLARAAVRRASIPMPGAAESLNVAAAAAVCLFEEVRQKAAVTGVPPPQPPSRGKG